MAVSFISGLLGGFAQSNAAGRKEAADDAERKSAKEDAILHLMATSDDPEIQHAALAGLTDTTPRKKGFLDNLVGGKYEANPALEHIRTLINSGKQVPGTPEGEGLPIRGMATPPPAAPAAVPVAAAQQQVPSGASAAMPATSAVQNPPAASQLASPTGPPPSLPAPTPIGAMLNGPVVGRTAGQPGTPARTVPRTIFKSPEQKAGDLLTSQMTAKVDFAKAHGATPEQQRNLGIIEAGGGAMFTPHNLPGLIPASAALGEADERGHVIDQADVAAGKRYRQTNSAMGGNTLREEAAPISSTKPTRVTAMVDPATHERDMTGTSTRQGVFMFNPTEKDPAKAYQFVGFLNAGPREQAFPFQWEDETGIHRELVYGEAKFDQGAGQQGASTPPPSGPPSAPSAAPTGGAAAGPPPAPPTASAPSTGGTSSGGITRVPVGSSPSKMEVAHARLPSGAFVSALRNPVSKKLIDPKTGQPLEGATDATQADVSKQQDAMGSLGIINAGLQDIEDLTRKVYPSGSGLLGGLEAGGALFLKRRMHDPDLAKLTSRVSLAAGPVARIVEMSNRMNLAVVARAAQALGEPTTGLLGSSSQEEALAKIQAVKDALTQQVDQMGIVIDPQGNPHQFTTRGQMDAFKARIAAHTGGR